MLGIEVVVARRALAMEDRAKVERDDLPFVLLPCALHTHHKGIEGASARVNQQTTTQLKHIGSVQCTLKETVSTIMRDPGNKIKINSDEVTSLICEKRCTAISKLQLTICAPHALCL